MKLTEYQKQLFSHVGEVVAVYDENHKQVWSHTNPKMICDSNHKHGLRVWLSFDNNKGPYGGDLTFILTSEGNAPEGVYEGESSDQEVVKDVIDCILVSICEDTSVWGQAAFDEPYLRSVDKIAGYAYRGEGKLFVSFSPDCSIWVEDGKVGFDT